MSRHDAVLANALGSNNPLIQALRQSLVEEIAAHDKTREDRNTQTRRATALHGSVRGLEQKAERLEKELKDHVTKPADDYARGYAEGMCAVKDAIHELFDTMVEP